MKKLLLLIWICVTPLLIFAQGEIQFSLLKASQEDIPQSVVETLDLRLKQVLTRNSAASADQYNVFVIEPVFELTDVLTSEGLMQNVSVAKGELTLMAKNKVDGAMYYSMVIPVKGNAVGDKEKAMKSLVSGIKSTDTAFTRFIRTTRQKIQDYYAANCATILQRAQDLYDQKKCQEAVSYLSAVSDALPCYEQASVLLKELSTPAPDTVVVQKVVEKIVEKPVEVERIVEVEKIVEKPVIVERIVEKPVEKEVPDLDCDITISTNTLQFKVLKCIGNTTQQRITILVEMTNMDTNRNSNEYLELISVFKDNGAECQNSDWPDGHLQRMPPRVVVRRELYITKVFDKFPSFSYIELQVGSARVYIRNLPIQWQ